MKFSFVSSTSYIGPASSLGLWPMPPRFCERDVAAFEFSLLSK